MIPTIDPGADRRPPTIARRGHPRTARRGRVGRLCCSVPIRSGRIAKSQPFHPSRGLPRSILPDRRRDWDGECDSSCDQPCTKVCCESFGRIGDHSVELRIHEINVFPDFCGRVVAGLPFGHEEERRMTDASLEELVQAGQKDRQPVVPVPFAQGNIALKNGFEIAFELLSIPAATG